MGVALGEGDVAPDADGRAVGVAEPDTSGSGVGAEVVPQAARSTLRPRAATDRRGRMGKVMRRIVTSNGVSPGGWARRRVPERRCGESREPPSEMWVS